MNLLFSKTNARRKSNSVKREAMKRLFFVVMLLAMVVTGLLVTQTAGAQGQARGTGNELIDACRSYVDFTRLPTNVVFDFFRRGYCDGLVRGISELAVSPYMDARYVCAPTGVTQGRFISVVHTYLQAHPERRHEVDWLVVLEALMDAFPCSE